MNLNNLEKKILNYRLESPTMNFLDVYYDLFLIKSSMSIFNPNKHLISQFELINGIGRLHYQISFKRSLTPSNRIFKSIYFIRFRESNPIEEVLILNKVKIKKVIISGWNGQTNWLLPF